MTRRLVLMSVPAAVFAVLVLATVGAAGGATGASDAEWSLAEKVVLFSSDGMRPDLVDKYASQGAMPTMAKLMDDGLKGRNGLLQAFPPNTGVGWATLATGTWPSEHGSTNNTFFRQGESSFNNRTGFADTGILQADTIAQSAERAQKTVVAMEWVAARSYVPALQGPVVDFRSFFSTRGVLTFPSVASEQAGAATFGLSYQVASFSAASGWSNTPTGDPAAPPQQAVLTVATTFSSQNPTRTYDVYIDDSVVNGVAAYDRVILVPSGLLKDASPANRAAELSEGEWVDIKLKGADGLIGTRLGQTAGMFVKLIDVAGGASGVSTFKLYFTSVQRVNATYNGCTPAPSCSTAFEEDLASRFPTSTAADFAPLEAGIVDEDTYVEQGLMWKDAHWAYLEYILDDLGVEPDLLMLGNPVTDEFQHQFMGLVTPTDMDGDPNPYFDDLTDDNVPDGRVAVREGYIRSAYEEADQTLDLARDLIGGDPTTFVSSDHGFAPQWYAVNVSKVLVDTGLAGAVQLSNCRAAATDKAKECHAGGTAQIYINPAQVTTAEYETVRNQIITAFQNLTDPANPGAKVVDAIFKKEQLRNVDGTDALHPNRSGDVVVVFRPPYQTDAASPTQTIAFSQFFGQHGYLPNLVDLQHNVNLHGTFIASGPGIRAQRRDVAGVRAIDVAPTIAFLMGIPGPQNARGKILYQLVALGGGGGEGDDDDDDGDDDDNGGGDDDNGGGRELTEITILDISDYHGQLVPLSETADTFASPTFAIGGAAFLKPWFDVYRKEARDGSITIAAGDSVGATPPISSFFGDKPTIELMNKMGFTADGLGNHNFDKGQAYLRNTLIPLAKFKYLSANIVDSRGRTPREWNPSRSFEFGDDVDLELIGFSNEDIPNLIFPGGLGPFQVTNATAAVNARAARARGADAVVAFGHLGATTGTLTSPAGPLIDLADNVKNVDAVVGDHTDFQVLTTRPNGVLVTENRSKGIRFTRLRLVVSEDEGVIYKTADFHKPWNIGVTPNAGIQARIDELNAQLAPILGVVIGNSTRFIPRADACGQSAGRTCESLVGNVTADALRLTYGTEFALTNSGGLRADLTCPTTDNPSDFCPSYTPPPFAISRGQVLTVLPFGNVAVTLTVNGAELKTMLERGVSAMPAADGRFPQISGLCLTYNISAAPSSRVTSAVRQAPGGSCTGAAVSFSNVVNYTLATNDFTASGGDGYPNFTGRFTTRDIMDQTLADYITANTPISPSIQGRIVCTTGGSPACPVVTP